MKYIYITSIFFLSMMPLAYADYVTVDLCNGRAMHNYDIYYNEDPPSDEDSSSNGISSRIRRKVEKGDEETLLFPEGAIDYIEEIEDFGSINYGQYRDVSEHPARYMKIIDCYTEASDKPPYYKFVANNPLDHLYQRRLWYLSGQYSFLSSAESSTRGGEILDDLLAHKNALCTKYWGFCFNAKQLTDVYEGIRMTCVEEAEKNKFSLKKFYYAGDGPELSTFLSPKNSFDRNTGEVILYDDTSYQDNSSPRKKDVRLMCKISLEKEILTSLDGTSFRLEGLYSY